MLRLFVRSRLCRLTLPFPVPGRILLQRPASRRALRRRRRACSSYFLATLGTELSSYCNRFAAVGAWGGCCLGRCHCVAAVGAESCALLNLVSAFWTGDESDLRLWLHHGLLHLRTHYLWNEDHSSP